LNQQRTVSNNDPEKDNTKEENIIKSLYDDNNENPSFINKCKNCNELEKKLLKSEQMNVNLMFENKKMKDVLSNYAVNLQQNAMHSCKKIFQFLHFFDNF
jgi:hypothetical protein